ncbi:DUF373 family protein [archaeon]|nr:DUF373 family protein [archaeon]
MPDIKNVLVVCVDRDDDLGRKAGIKGPVIGRKNNINAAARLAVKDPTDSDVNSIFGAVKAFDELKGRFEGIEIVTLTGAISRGFEADKSINEQLDRVLEAVPAEGFVFISDGADDDTILPLIQGRLKLISKKMILVKQAQGIESTYVTVIEALKDPFLSKVVFGIPGIILLLYYFLGAQSLQIIALVLGIYLLLKGFGIEEPLLKSLRKVTSSISIHRISFPFYLATLFIFIFALVNAYSYYAISLEKELALKVIASSKTAYLFLALASYSYIIGKAIDAVSLKQAFKLRKHIVSAVSVLLVWLILDSGTEVVLGKADLYWFLVNIIASFAVLLLAFRASSVFDARQKITKLLIGLPVYDSEGKWLGKVSQASKAKQGIAFRNAKTRKKSFLRKHEFSLSKGRIIALP